MKRKEITQQIFEKDLKKLKAFIRSRVMEEEETEEILQETMVSACESWPLFSGRSSSLTWLCGIAKHEIADFYRKKKIKIFLFSHIPWLDNLASEALGPEQIFLRKEFERRVIRVLNNLDKGYQQVLRLKYYQDLSIKEIAGELNESAKTIESRLFRARKAFIKAFPSDLY